MLIYIAPDSSDGPTPEEQLIVERCSDLSRGAVSSVGDGDGRAAITELTYLIGLAVRAGNDKRVLELDALLQRVEKLTSALPRG